MTTSKDIPTPGELWYRRTTNKCYIVRSVADIRSQYCTKTVIKLEPFGSGKRISAPSVPDFHKLFSKTSQIIIERGKRIRWGDVKHTIVHVSEHYVSDSEHDHIRGGYQCVLESDYGIIRIVYKDSLIKGGAVNI